MTSDSQPAAEPANHFTAAVNRLVYALSRHWLALFNILVALYIGFPVLAPVLMNAGVTAPARVIYTLYSPLCHQMASRSFFLFGDQIAYPRAVAGTSLTPIEAYMPSLPEFEEASPNPAEWTTFIWSARRFVGNEQMGYKMALCERDMGIYGAVLVAGLVYGLLRRRKKFRIRGYASGPNQWHLTELSYRQVGIRPLPVWGFLLLGLGPIALDGFSQLFSQYLVALAPPGSSLLDLLPLRESTPFLRTLTGSLFGISLVWMTYPYIDASMRRTAESQSRQLAEAENQPPQ